MKKVDILNGNIFQTILFLTFPILICGLFQQLYNLVNIIVIGHSVGTDGIAVIGGATSTLISLFNGTSNGVITGCMIITSHNHGSGNKEKTVSAIQTALLFCFGLGIGMNLLYFFGASTFLEILNVPADIFNDSVQYLQLYSFGFLFAYIFQLIINLFRAIGETSLPTKFLILSFLLNIALDVFFIVVLKQNEKGVAYAFIATQLISAVVAYHYLSLQFDISIKSMLLNRGILSNMIKIGIPSAFVSICYSLTNLVINFAINQLGNEVIASYAINNRIENLFWIFMTGLGFAIATFVGQNHGAGQQERIQKSVRIISRIGYGLTFIVSILIYFFRYPLAELFSTDRGLIEQAAGMLRFMAPIYFTYTGIEIFSQILKGMGKVIIPTYLTLIFICGVRISWIFFYALDHLTPIVVMMAYPLSWIITTISFIVYYLYVSRKVFYNTMAIEKNLQ